MNSFVNRLRHDQRGAVAILVAFALIVFVGFSAIVVDIGYLMQAHRMLQASTDAAALAGATQLSSGTGAAHSAANMYSAASGGKNADANLSVTADPQTVNCTGSTGATCTVTGTNANGVKVTETATVPLFFARALGINSAPISTAAFALASGGKARNTDVMIIIDTTGSMNNSDSCPPLTSPTSEDCALAGFRTLLNGFTPPTQQVGLMVFPGLKNAADAAMEYDCSSSTPSSTAHYNASPAPVYLVVPLSNDYQTSPGVLNTSSNLVKASRGGASGCTAGLTAIGGSGTFYADVVTAAQNYLTTNGRAGVNKMIIVLSDGDANSSYASNPHQECHQAITAATAAQAAGTTVVTVAYGSTGSCSTDTSPTISACQTMLQMASVGSGTRAAPQWFFSDTGSSCTGAYSASNLNAIFTSIGSSVTGGGARLIPAT